VSYELLYRPEADEALDRLESDPAMGKALNAIDNCLDRLEDEPFDRRLGTLAFQAEEFSNVNATPARYDEWYIIWRRGPRPRTIEIIAVAQLDV
jgi:thymidylate synthase